MNLTLFSIPKPFRGHINVIQRNAIQSWLKICPKCEIILFGSEEGAAEAANSFGVKHIPAIKRNEFGTPLLDSAFALAQKIASYDILTYINTDIILMSDFLIAVKRVAEINREFLAVGRRWDVDINEFLEFSDGWQNKLRLCALKNGKLHARTGMDYFVFPKGLMQNIPPFAVGRAHWDPWLVYNMRYRKIPVIDITKTIVVVHQNHNYAHHPRGKDGLWKGEEAMRNLRLTGGYSHCFTIDDANYELTRNGIRLKITPYKFYRILVILSDKVPFIFKPILKAIRAAFGRSKV